MKNVTIHQPTTIENEKGQTIEWCKGIEGKQVSIYYRKKGQQFAEHFHTGADPSKNPERFFLISGKVKMTFWDGRNDVREEHEVASGTEVLVGPYIYHTAEAVEDSIFIEYRQTPFSASSSDTFDLAEYHEYLKNHQKE